jgi:hypothetical protein
MSFAVAPGARPATLPVTALPPERAARTIRVLCAMVAWLRKALELAPANSLISLLPIDRD